MAMLAEPKRKSKYSTDPRGLIWSNDNDKFGQKLMEKMGWQKGKGLGANEDGNVDHVKAQVKLDTTGVGCSKSFADNWVAHQDDFNALLAGLNADQGVATEGADEAAKVQRLEEKGKTARGRLHYKKFTKGKDLSRASGVDMDCIFGRRKSRSEPASPKVQSEANSDAESTASDPEQAATHGVKTLTSSLSVQEYFKAKMAALKNGSRPETDTSESTSKKRKYEENSPCSSDATSEEQPKKKKKKKKTKKQTDNVKTDDGTQESNVNIENSANKEFDTCACDDNNLPPKTKKKKKKKDIEVKIQEECDKVEKTELVTKNKSKKKKKSKSKNK